MFSPSNPIQLLNNLSKKYSESTIGLSEICKDIIVLSKAIQCVCFQISISNNDKKIISSEGDITEENTKVILDKLQIANSAELPVNTLIPVTLASFSNKELTQYSCYFIKLSAKRPYTCLLLVFNRDTTVHSELIELFASIVSAHIRNMLSGNIFFPYEKAFKYSGNLCFFLNKEGVLQHFSGSEPEVEVELFPRSLFEGDKITDKLNFLYVEEFQKWIADTLKGENIESELELQTNSNSCFLKIICTPEYINEEIVGVIIVISNITYTRELERSLNEITQITNSVNQSAIVSITDNNGAITYVNTRFELVSGYSLTDLLGRTHNVVDSGMHDRVFWKDFWMHINSGKVWRGVIINKRKNDDLYWVDSTISPMFDHTGEIESYISIGFEVTENELIKKELDKKEILISETHHRIKNNLQIVRSLLSLQRKKYDNKELQKTILDSENRIMAMAMVHESIYHNHNADKLSLKHYLHSFMGELSNSYLSPDTIIELNIEDGYLESSALISLGIIINELVSNTSKYAFGTSTKDKIVSLRGEKLDTCYKLRYSDNGPGLSEGIDYKSLKSLGINLILGLGKQMKAKPIIWNENGFNFEITIPYKTTK